jgi:acyl-coenzyme A synthetase/AMP-(fatty) acid ligase
MDRENLAEYIHAQSIDLATLTPSLLFKGALLDLKTLVMAGEAPNQEITTAYLEKGVTVINAYGPTETTVCATVRFCDKGSGPTNIGHPIANATCYVLDEQQQPLPIGTVGELYVGGAGVARGYWHLNELTEARFIPNPFRQERDSSKLYRTGDLVRILPDGSFDYLGRSDHQVKVRGHRVELKEIEIQLNSYPGVQQSVVLPIANHAGQAYQGLIGYYVAPAPISREHLLTYLDRQLPGYMVPQFLVHLSALPVNANGKLDRHALPSPYSTTQDTQWLDNSVEANYPSCSALCSVLRAINKLI